MHDIDYLYGGVSIILRFVLYLAIPVLAVILFRSLIVGFKSEKTILIVKRFAIIIFTGLMILLCFVDFTSLPVGIKEKKLNNALLNFESKTSGIYDFCYGVCNGRVFIDEFENYNDTQKALENFAEYHQTDINDYNGINYSISSYECLRASYKRNGFLGGISDETGAWVSIIGNNKQIRICFSYFDSGIGSIFRGLIPFDVLIRPKLDLEKVSNEMKIVSD